MQQHDPHRPPPSPRPPEPQPAATAPLLGSCHPGALHAAGGPLQQGTDRPSDRQTDRPQQQVSAAAVRKLQSVGLIRISRVGRVRFCFWFGFRIRLRCYVMLQVNGHCSFVKLSPAVVSVRNTCTPALLLLCWSGLSKSVHCFKKRPQKYFKTEPKQTKLVQSDLFYSQELTKCVRLLHCRMFFSSLPHSLPLNRLSDYVMKPLESLNRISRGCSHCFFFTASLSVFELVL